MKLRKLAKEIVSKERDTLSPHPPEVFASFEMDRGLPVPAFESRDFDDFAQESSMFLSFEQIDSELQSNPFRDLEEMEQATEERGQLTEDELDFPAVPHHTDSQGDFL
jgi:hypothetical protein